MTDCSFCQLDVATIACDKCGHIRFCKACYREDVVDCLCRECIMLSRDCNFCADRWRMDEGGAFDLTSRLALVCTECTHGYCQECVVQSNGELKCPQCYDTLGRDPSDAVDADQDALDEIEHAESEYYLARDLKDLDREKSEKVKRDSTAEIERQLEELGPHAVAAPPARRRRRNVKFSPGGPTYALGNIPEKEMDERVADQIKKIVKDEKPVRQKRADNVLEDVESCALQLHPVEASRILLAQANGHLRKRYRIVRAREFNELVHQSKSFILGSYPLEVMLAETYEDSDLDIYCTETSAVRLQALLPPEYRKTVSQKKYASMAELSYVRHVDTWELPHPHPQAAQVGIGSLARIQFIIMTDTRRVADYLQLADITVVQNQFDGRTFSVADLRTLDNEGTVIRGSPMSDRVCKYYRRGFRLQITLTDDIATKIF